MYQQEQDALSHLRREVEREIGTSWENYLPNVGYDEKMEPNSVELHGQTWEVWREIVH